MTPLQAASRYCANYDKGECAGLDYMDNLTAFRFRSGHCVFKDDPCDACPYFEAVVLPQVGSSVSEAYRKQLKPEAQTSIEKREIRLCPDCHRNELVPRQRVCANCARIRRRKSEQLCRTK